MIFKRLLCSIQFTVLGIILEYREKKGIYQDKNELILMFATESSEENVLKICCINVEIYIISTSYIYYIFHIILYMLSIYFYYLRNGLHLYISLYIDIYCFSLHISCLHSVTISVYQKYTLFYFMFYICIFCRIVCL